MAGIFNYEYEKNSNWGIDRIQGRTWTMDKKLSFFPHVCYSVFCRYKINFSAREIKKERAKGEREKKIELERVRVRERERDRERQGEKEKITGR